MEAKPALIWKSRLEAVFGADGVTAEDESHRHAGHAHGPSAERGGTHAAVRVVSSRFDGLALPARHRLIYSAIGFGSAGDPLHALTIQALTPAEAAAQARDKSPETQV